MNTTTEQLTEFIVTLAHPVYVDLRVIASSESEAVQLALEHTYIVPTYHGVNFSSNSLNTVRVLEAATNDDSSFVGEDNFSWRNVIQIDEGES